MYSEKDKLEESDTSQALSRQYAASLTSGESCASFETSVQVYELVKFVATKPGVAAKSKDTVEAEDTGREKYECPAEIKPF